MSLILLVDYNCDFVIAEVIQLTRSNKKAWQRTKMQ